MSTPSHGMRACLIRPTAPVMWHLQATTCCHSASAAPAALALLLALLLCTRASKALDHLLHTPINHIPLLELLQRVALALLPCST